MMKISLLTIVIAVFFLSSCSHQITVKASPKVIQRYDSNPLIEQHFSSYVERFKVAYYILNGQSIKLDNITMKLTEFRNTRKNTTSPTEKVTKIKEAAVGVCLWSPVLPIIYVDEERWYTFTDMQREMLIFHELGHCAMRRDHCDATYKDLPVSIMKSVLISERTYVQNREYYHNELFREPACNNRF